MNKWYIDSGKESGIVLSVRIRLARNLADYPFVNRMTNEQKFEVIQKISDAVLKSGDPAASDFVFYDMSKLDELEAYSMAERHIISPEFASGGEGRALLLSKDESLSIMLNEEDHVRIQAMCAGLDLEKALNKAFEIERLIEKSVKFAFHPHIGYLTECPTNLGTGMRASAMLHLYALERMNALPNISNTVAKMGMTIRGTYGEGSDAAGALYQISNQVTLGISEKNAVEGLENIVKQIISRENEARNSIDRFYLEDVIYRSIGTMKYARSICSEEFMNFISYIRMGASMGIINIPLELVNTLVVQCQSAALRLEAGKPLDARERDAARASKLREGLSAY